jgi:beta-glucanase (GH16 family)
MIRNIAAALSLSFLATVGSTAQAATLDPSAYAWDLTHAGEPLDLKGYVVTFSDEFNTSQITADGRGGPWFAPIHADVGPSIWDKPGTPYDVYTVADGVLSIRATKAADGRWHAGNIQTIDGKGKGFSQLYGYFEARIQFPQMPGAWCAFWLKSVGEIFDPSIVRAEIDVVEWYGGDPKGHHETVHLWPPTVQYQTAGVLTKHWYKSNYTGLPKLASGYHTHGVLITPQFVIMYVDRKEVSRFPTLDEFKVPLYPLVSLTLYEQDLAKAVSPFEMQVDYVRIYSNHVPKAPVINGIR